MANEAAKVARLCTEASDTKILDLSNCKLKNIPMAIYMMTNSFKDDIIKVNLSNNNLKKIPDKIFSHFHQAGEIVVGPGNEFSEDYKTELINCWETERMSIIFE